MTEQPSISVDTGQGWVAIPTGGETPDEYGPAVVGELGDLVPDESRDALALDLTMFASRARQSGAIFAAVLVPDPADCVLAYTECRAIDLAESGLPSDAAAMADLLGADEVDPPGWRHITAVDLPPGPAVRIHALDAEPDEPVGSGADLPVVESVTHILPLGPRPAVMLTTSWAALLAAGQLVEDADRLASTLTVQP